jgi:hypothetical protein
VFTTSAIGASLTRLRSLAAAVAHEKEPPLGLITVTVMLGSIMAIFDASIVNVALDTMADNLGVRSTRSTGLPRATSSPA